MTFELRLRNGTGHAKILGRRTFQTEELVQKILQWEQANIAGTKGVRGRLTEEEIGESQRDRIT